MSTNAGPSPDHPNDGGTLHFEECLCPITVTVTPLPLDSRIPTPSDPTLPGQCIYHQRLQTREAETAIFIQLAPEIDELKEVLHTGMVRFKRGGPGGQIVLKTATSEQLSEASDGLKALIAERERLVRELWARFVLRWGGRVDRRDDGTMFVVDEGRHLLDLEQEEDQDQDQQAEGAAEGDGNTEATTTTGRRTKKTTRDADDDDDDDSNKNNEADPYVRRMREVQARMDDLNVANQRKEAKRAKAAKKAEEYAASAATPTPTSTSTTTTTATTS